MRGKKFTKYLLLALSFALIGWLIMADNKESITLATDDGVKLSAYYLPSDSSRGVILLHMLNSNKESYDELAKLLNKKGYSLIAVDFRGHGKSELNWRSFESADFKKMTLDVKSAHEFLAGKNISDVYIVGASIGANTAITYVADNDVKAIVLLSPGLDYRSVGAGEPAQSYESPVFIAVSEEDEYSYESSKAIYDLVKSSDKEIKVYKNAGHGTAMFGKTDLKEKIVSWLALR